MCAAHFCLHHLRSLVTDVFQRGSDVNFTCSFAYTIQDSIQKNEASCASHTITESWLRMSCTSLSLDRRSTHLQWTMIGDDRPRKHLFTFLENQDDGT